MNNEKTDPLLEWNRLNKENAEQGFVSAMYASMVHTSPVVDKFSLWLLVGAGASGSLLISQIKDVLPYLTPAGFRNCLITLVVSAIFGFIAKYKSLRCEVQTEIEKKINELMAEVFAKHEEDETKIQEYAAQKKLDLPSEIDFTNVITEFSKPFPFWIKWFIRHQARKAQGNQQASHHIAVKAYLGQLRYTFLQAISFLAFLCAGAWYARAI